MKRFLTFAVLGAAVLVGSASVGFAEIKAGQEMVVSTNNAQLMRGDTTLATLPAGQRFHVIRTEGAWVGTRVTVNGRSVSGWLSRRQAATPQQFAERPARRYSYQPGAAGDADRGPNPYATNTLPPDMGDYVTGGVRSGSPLIMGATTFGPEYWRADRKIVGL